MSKGHGEKMKKTYIKAYKASAIVFVAGIPTVIVPFIGVGMAAGTTAHLLAGLIKSQRIRAVYYAVSLFVSAAFVAVCAVILANGTSSESALGIIPLLLFAGVVFAGIAAAFAVRLVLWRQLRAYYKRAEAGRSGVNFYE
ncbi:MAG: hypothetical protein FWE74_08950 [Oscillospiraceae bacterium]|nr:hypothetical protein [Oscillospiraceae bacterium]